MLLTIPIFKVDLIILNLGFIILQLAIITLLLETWREVTIKVDMHGKKMVMDIYGMDWRPKNKKELAKREAAAKKKAKLDEQMGYGDSTGG